MIGNKSRHKFTSYSESANPPRRRNHASRVIANRRNPSPPTCSLTPCPHILRRGLSDLKNELQDRSLFVPQDRSLWPCTCPRIVLSRRIGPQDRSLQPCTCPRIVLSRKIGPQDRSIQPCTFPRIDLQDRSFQKDRSLGSKRVRPLGSTFVRALGSNSGRALGSNSGILKSWLTQFLKFDWEDTLSVAEFHVDSKLVIHFLVRWLVSKSEANFKKFEGVQIRQNRCQNRF